MFVAATPILQHAVRPAFHPTLLTPLDSALTDLLPVTPLDSALTKSTSRNSFRICTYKKRGEGVSVMVNHPQSALLSAQPLPLPPPSALILRSTRHPTPRSKPPLFSYRRPLCRRGGTAPGTLQASRLCHPRNLPTQLVILLLRDSVPIRSVGVYSAFSARHFALNVKGPREAKLCNFQVRGF